MATLEIPTRTDGTEHYSFQIELDGRTYELEFSWNERDAAWRMAVLDLEGRVLASPRKVVLVWPLLSRKRSAELPPGEFVAFDSTGRNLEPGLGDLGGRVRLLYVEAASLPAGYRDRV